MVVAGPAGAPVATPLAWDEFGRRRSLDGISFTDAVERLDSAPWRDASLLDFAPLATKSRAAVDAGIVKEPFDCFRS